MSNNAIIKELMEIEQSAAALQQRSSRLRRKLEGDSSPSSARKGLDTDTKNRLITKRNKKMVKV